MIDSKQKNGELAQIGVSKNHSLRQPMLQEIYARPFLKLPAPSRLAFIALKPEEDGIHNRERSRTQLIAFLDRFGAEHPEQNAVYYFVKLGAMTLKWENHSEFATYTLFTQEKPSAGDGPFANDLHEQFTSDWIEAFPGRIISSVIGEILQCSDSASLETRVRDEVMNWFQTPAGFAAAYVTDQSAAIASDFISDRNGHIRMALLACDSIGPGRIGRAAQRFMEVETYRALSMLTLPVARKILAELGEIDKNLSSTVEAMGEKSEKASSSLDDLLKISSELALLSTRSSFRFSAARAYEHLVNQRLELLREDRFMGRQMISELIHRGYNPAMRTCRSANQQLEDMAERAAKASELLGTRVSVTTAEQNRKLLAKMDTRAAQQARLQETVEGISVVAISYYAVSLLTYLLTPVTKFLPISKTVLAAALVLPVLALVWFSMHRVKEKLIRDPEKES